MRNEKNLIKGENASTNCITPIQGPESEVSQNLPICLSCDDIEVPRNGGEKFAFNASEFVIHEYLQKTFNDRNLYDFMDLYTDLSFSETQIFPIAAQKVICVLMKVSDVNQLIGNQTEPRSVLADQQLGKEALSNLHDNGDYTVTLVECDFDISKLPELEDYYFYKTEHYQFLIKSSALKMNFTILYKKIEEG